MPTTKPMLETPDYLHFKHKFGFIHNFTELYQAFYWSCRQREIDIDHKKCNLFFMKYIENMGIEHEFKKAIIDPRSFTYQISIDGKAGATHRHINAGRLYSFQPLFIPLIDINNLTECSLTIDGITHTLTLEES